MSSSKLTLGDIVELIRGTTYKGKLLGQPGPYLLGLASIQKDGGFRDDNLKTYGGETADKLLLYPGDIFVSLKDVTQSANLLGAVARVPESISIGRLTQDTLKLVFKRRSVPSEFIYWILRTPQYRAYCKAHATGTTTLGLSRDDFLSFPVPEYDGATSFLVELLESIEKKIRLNNQTARTLEELAQRLFKSWFVDFDPVRAKMGGRQPAHMPSETAALFPDRLVDSTLGLIPEGWQSSSFYDSVDVISGGTPKTKVEEYWDGDIPWYSVVDHPRGGTVFVVSTEKAITESGLGNSAAKLVPEFTTILSARGTVGKVALSGKAMTFNQSCYGFRGRSSDHFRVYFQTMNMVDYLQSVAHGSVFSTITRDTLKSVQVVQPTEIVREEFESFVEPLMGRILSLKFENDLLTELRDRLLPKLISGEIRVPEAQEMAEEA